MESAATAYRPKLPEELQQAPLRRSIDRIFTALVAAAGNNDNEFVIVSSLAEGSDRIVAAAGLAAGFKLEIVLPFDPVEYVRDFETQASRAEFCKSCWPNPQTSKSS